MITSKCKSSKTQFCLVIRGSVAGILLADLAPRKWPELNLKSPGIKVRTLANRSHVPNLTTNVTQPHLVPPTSSPRLSESGGGEDTPRTPLTAPHTPPPPLADYSVFAPIQIGAAGQGLGNGLFCSMCVFVKVWDKILGRCINLNPDEVTNCFKLKSGNTSGNQSPGAMSCAPISLSQGVSVSPSPSVPPTPAPIPVPIPSPSPMPPPPLPPRSRKRESSISDLPSTSQQITMSNVSTASAPMLPPRDLSPPPLPPRPSVRRSSTVEHPTQPLNILAAPTQGYARHMSFNGPQPHHSMGVLPQHAKSNSVPVSMTRHNTLNLTARVTGPPALRAETSTPKLPPKPFKSNVMFQFNTNQT
ncbi:hypothetical protein J6590_032553 [Homalodisca vitripennis]|nr:hypothetical protein J6590_032553 [Homalodisca vitripennis]